MLTFFFSYFWSILFLVYVVGSAIIIWSKNDQPLDGASFICFALSPLVIIVLVVVNVIEFLYKKIKHKSSERYFRKNITIARM